MVMLRVEDLRFGYHATPVLDGIGFEIGESKLVGITGPNGSGKTTLVKCIVRILKARSGAIYINDTPLGRYGQMDLARTLAYVPQTFSDGFSTTVFDTILMGRRPHYSWTSRRRDYRAVEEIIIRMGLEKIAMSEFNQLSGGQQQKVQIARAIVQQPDILLLDEPVASLDIRHQHEVMNLLASLTQEKKIICLVVIHDLNLALKYMDDLILMQEGRIFAQGTPPEVLSETNLEQVYGIKVNIVCVEQAQRDHRACPRVIVV